MGVVGRTVQVGVEVPFPHGVGIGLVVWVLHRGEGAQLLWLGIRDGDDLFFQVESQRWKKPSIHSSRNST